MKKALITGITGQDGAYLAELLLSKGYEVHGIKRRSSLFNTDRIDHLYQDPHIEHRNFVLHYGDLTDSTNLIRIVQEVQPDEIYNLGAMSHVKVSFETPEYTANADGIGALRLLEAIRLLGLEKKTKFYQASTSELYGLVQEVPQSERTPFYPRSPYAVAKLYAYWITVNYREAYNLFAVNGILFNHETVAEYMPMIFRIGKNGPIDIKPIVEVVKHHTNPGRISINTENYFYQETTVSEDLYVWDAQGWTKVLYASGYPHDPEHNQKHPRFLVSKNAAYMATGSHMCIMADGSEKSFGNIELGDKVALIDYPSEKPIFELITPKVAELLGFFAGDGSLKENRTFQLTSKDKSTLEYYAEIWTSLNPRNSVGYWQTSSGFNRDNKIWQVRLNNAPQWAHQFDLYDSYHRKRVPVQILNAAPEIQLAYLKGFNDADGLKSNPCKYEFKNFKTNSATLAAGLLYLLKKTTGQDYNINLERSKKWGWDTISYSINILSNSDKGQNHRNSGEKIELVSTYIANGISQRETERLTGISRTFIRKVQHGLVVAEAQQHHLAKPNNEIKKIIDMPEYNGWFFDLTTESGTFHCGVGQGHVHNSPLRGETFVTRKITRGVAQIALGLADKIYLGNLDAQRDWGHAKDFVEGMYLMLQQPDPEDFVLATGVTTAVRDFVRLAFREIGVELEFSGEGVDEVGIVSESNHPDFQLPVGKPVVAVDPRYFRPAEVDLLIGDAAKAHEKLGWTPRHTLHDLVREMVAGDIDLFRRDKVLRDAGFATRSQYE